ncbi:Valine--tRNA ligase [Chionoecetes opilio]|uniref:valine--tRNA ligase n=1 Tax=Chionoecetes opilio TaxID=41210 RepID=A0A8J4Y686_CHIOP|nr:Valine--tRNA ligase [Chionoecetes opilio]
MKTVRSGRDMTFHSYPFLTVVEKSPPLCQFEPRFEARTAVLAALSALGLCRGCRAYPMTVPRCSRTHDVIEPHPQTPVVRICVCVDWMFINCKELAREASEAVHSGRLVLVPGHPRKAWHGWLDNIKGLVCVSAALAFPVASVTSAAQEQDVSDTRFSSALFPFAALGWPGTQGQHATPDLTRLYPTTLLETGHDILFFWVARRVMLGLKLTGKLPFEVRLWLQPLLDL